MSFTFTDHAADGVTTTFPFRFAGKDKGYIRASDIAVYVLNAGSWVPVLNWTLTGTNQITFSTPPASSGGINIRIRRVVPKDNPYAEFTRGPALDMRSMNYAYTQNLQVSQELLDGFLPEGFFYKSNLNMGGYKVVNMAAGTAAGEAVEYSQLVTVDQKHEVWNARQDIEIAGLKSSLSSGTSHRTIPWYVTAYSGQTLIEPPYQFTSALVFIQGVMQYEIAGAFSIENNKITLAEGLNAGEEVLVLVGSRIASPEDGVAEINIDIPDGATVVNLNVDFSLIDVNLDGLRQPTTAYVIEDQTVRFLEPMPACKFSAIVVVPKGGNP